MISAFEKSIIFLDNGVWSDSVTTFINASTCNICLLPQNPPVLFDIELPVGVTKESFFQV